MNQVITLSGLGDAQLKDELCASLIATKPQFVGIASAFVSTSGVEDLQDILKASGGPQCHLIAGTDNAITHPEALYSARRLGWKTRLGKAPIGIFHPKLLIAGRKLSRAGTIGDLCCVYVGSSNLTGGGLRRNVECGFVARDRGCLQTAATAFHQLWRDASLVTDRELRNYAARFAETARRRKAADLDDLGINESLSLSASPTDLRTVKPPVRSAVSVEFAAAAWAGLQSFTGEYRFQLEFPRDAGVVIRQLLQASHVVGPQVDVYCPKDGVTRRMQYKFYSDNGMFRLNIQNNFPGVAWARKHRDGIAIIEKGPQGGAPLQLQFLQPGGDAAEIARRSVALGSWGRTPTRIYGWY